MTTHKVKREIDEEIMRNFFKFLGKQKQDITSTAFTLATYKSTGTYADMFLEATIVQHFCVFLLQENITLINKIVKEQSTPIRDLLKLGLIKSDVELFKTY